MLLQGCSAVAFARCPRLLATRQLGPHHWKGPLKAHRLGLQLDVVLKVLESMEREVEEVARSTSGIEHRKAAQPFEEPGQ